MATNKNNQEEYQLYSSFQALNVVDLAEKTNNCIAQAFSISKNLVHVWQKNYIHAEKMRGKNTF